jgi:Arc/MetJ-type ribon-helix-helix transcriptional regulator
MKKKLSISIEEKTITKIDDFIEDGAFRNKSHLIEFALNKFLESK